MSNHHHTQSVLFSSTDESTASGIEQPSQNEQVAPDDGMEIDSAQRGPEPSPEPIAEESTTDESPGYELPLDQIFGILKNNRRRETLRYLHENNGKTSLSDVAEHIAALENDTTVRQITSSQRKRVYVGLYQCHLPKMDDADTITFDQKRGTIEFGPNASQLDSYLEKDENRSWHNVYLGTVIFGSVLFAVSLLGGSLMGLTSTVVLTILLATILVCAGAQYRLAS